MSVPPPSSPPVPRETRREPSWRHPLAALLAPSCVAVIGATEQAGSVGRAVMENLAAFGGRVVPVNPRRPSVLGRPAFPHLADVPGNIDLAVIATPAPTVPGLIRECTAAGVPGAIVLSAGFKETGPAGAAMEQEILAVARAGGLRLIGPNCLGAMMPHTGFNATFATGIARPGNVAFISQSGALCTAILDWSLRENVGFSGFVSVGSMLDVGWGDLIEYFGDDPHTRSIVCYMESVGDARRFLSAAREVSLTKPIIVIKVGRTTRAAQAAASHTGALTGSDAVLDAVFRRAGVLRVDTIGELFGMAGALAKQPRPRGPRLAIVTNAGGPAALSTDWCIGSGGELAELSPATRERLNDLLPPHWSHGNPVDILGDADAVRYAEAVRLVADDPGNDGLLVILTPQKMTPCTEVAERLAGLVLPSGKPLLASWMGGAGVDAAEAVLNEAGIPTFRYPDTAARAFALMWRYADNLRLLYETPAFDPGEGGGIFDAAGDPSAAGRVVIDRVRAAGRTLLDEVESKELLAAYGIPTVETHRAATAGDAVLHADRLGYPVVVKLFSTTLTHKTDVGGVCLNIPDAAGVRDAFARIRDAVQERAGAEHFQGVSVQPMIPPDGCELILGASVDPQFGPVLLFGAGGQLVEVLRDTVTGLPPLNTNLARRLMEGTRIYKALLGVRGRPPVDLPALDRILVRFSQLVVEQPWIAELDVNPLLVAAGRIVALDARVVLHPASLTAEDLPRPAIRPYPAQYRTAWQAPDGTALSLRPIRPEDEPMLLRFAGSSPGTNPGLQRFLGLPPGRCPGHEHLSRLCFIDYDREMVLVAERHDPATGESTLTGLGRLRRRHGTRDGEFALVVGARWAGRGLATELLRHLVRVACDERYSRIQAVLPGDEPALHRVAVKAGFSLQPRPDGMNCDAELVL